MRSLLLAATLALLAGAPAPAAAADLPAAPAPAYKAPAMAPVPYYDWSGFYLGGHVGGAWSHTNGAITDTATGAFVVSGSQNRSGIAGGGQIGLNYMLAPSWLIGLEADLSATDLSGTVQAPNGSNQHDYKDNLFGTVRGRLGYAVNNWLVYGTGGFGWSEGQTTRTQIFGTLHAATPGTVETVDNTKTGWAAGAGLEWGFAPNWTAKVEYLHLGLGNASTVFPLAGRRTDETANIDTVRFGVNYLFNWGTVPVTTRY